MSPFAALKLSVVVPVFRNEATLERLQAQLEGIAGPLFREVEFIYVNDGSPDDSATVLARLAGRDKRVKVISFARNFGEHAGQMGGMSAATGDLVFLIAADLEEDPGDLPRFLERLREGFDVVVGVRETARGFWRSLAAHAFTWVYNALSDHPIIGNATTMRLMSRRYVSFLLQMTERPFVGGFTAWIGMPVGTVLVEFRDQGRKSGYSFRRLLSHARHGIIGFSVKIMRLAIFLGLITSGSAFAYGSWLIVKYFLYQVPLGYTSMIVALLFLMGISFLLIGILGEYVAEVHIAVKRRPNWLVLDKLNF